MERGKRICRDCLYVKLYEMVDLEIESDFEFLYEIAASTLDGGDLKKDRGWLKVFYESSKRWKEKNDHDCYLKENMDLVKPIENENIKLIK